LDEMADERADERADEMGRGRERAYGSERKAESVSTWRTLARAPSMRAATWYRLAHSCSSTHECDARDALTHPGAVPHCFQPGWSRGHELYQHGQSGEMARERAASRSASHVAGPSLMGEKCSKPTWRRVSTSASASLMPQKSKEKRMSSPRYARARTAAASVS
jgi:hypothetical protein